MRAATRSRYGGPDVLRHKTIPDPTPGPGELLVRVRATTVNRTDTAYRSGRPWINRLVCGWPRPRVTVLGSEYSGVVEALGEDVHGWDEGERVAGFVDGRPGAYAELVAVPANGLVLRVPDDLDLEAAAGTAEGGHYAHACLRVTHLRPGDRALVHGATGAIGTALVQLLRAKGADVTAVCDRLPPDRLDLLTALGAHHVVDLSVEGLAAAGTDFAAVFDATGHLPFAVARPMLRAGGSYVSSDPGGLALLLAAASPVTRRLGRRHVRFPYPRATTEVAADLERLLASGAYRPVVDRTHGFDELCAAHTHVDTGRKVGSVVVRAPQAKRAAT